MALTTTAQKIIQSSSTGTFPSQYWELMDRYRGELMNQAHAILGNVDDAEDVVQETYCEAFRDARRMKNLSSIGAWLRSVNRFNALSRVRARRQDNNRLERKQQEMPERLVTTGGLNAVEMRESVTKAIETLPNQLRSIVVLRYWEHLSYKEIAKRLSIPMGSVGTMLYEASQLLYGKLGAQLSDATPSVNQQSVSAARK